MALVTSHTLNGVNGSHADGIVVSLRHLPSNTVLFSQPTQEGGRLSVAVNIDAHSGDDDYELVFETDRYWAGNGISEQDRRLMRQIVLRFKMPDAQARYHMPLIISPHSYSCWWSVPE